MKILRIIKIGDTIYENIYLYTEDENGNRIYNIPTDITELKQAVNDTLGYLTMKKISSILVAVDKKDAAMTKAICLLAKVINSLSPDTTVLTDKEQTAFKAMVSLADSGYTDSELLNNALTEISSALAWYESKASELESLNDFDSIVSFLSDLK